MILTCDFCKVNYDMDKVPKPIIIEGKGLTKVYICKSCIKSAINLLKPEMGPNWPKKKENR